MRWSSSPIAQGSHPLEDLNHYTDAEEHWTDDLLANQFRLSLLEFIEIFGARWRSLTDLTPVEDSPSRSLDVPTWHIAGDPPQLLLRVNARDDTFQLAMPEGTWPSGTHGLVYQPRNPHTFPLLAPEEAQG